MLKKISFLFKREYLILYFIIFVGLLLRLPGIFTNSFAFTYDVGRDMLALWNIVYFHKIPLIGATTGLPGVFYGPWWYYLLTPFFLIFSGNPQGIAFGMSLVGILSIIFAYILGKRLGENFLGLSLAAIISVSPVMVSLSSQIWNPKIAPLFVIFVLLVLSKIYSLDKRNKSKYYFLLGLLLAFIIDLEIVFGLLLFIGIILSVIFTVKRKISIKHLFYFAFGGLIIFAPRIFFEFRHGFLMTKSFVAFFTNVSSSHQASTFLNTLINRLNILFDQFNSTLGAENKLISLLILLFISFTLLFLYRKTNLLIKNFINTSLLVIFIFLLGIIFFSHDIWPHYLVGLPVFYILLFGICLHLLYSKFSNKFVPVLILLIIFIIDFNPVNLIQSLSSPLWIGDASVYRNQLEIIDYVYKQSGGKNFKYVVYTPPVHDYTYRYLFMWYGPKNYHYLPVVQSHLAYFILEPDLQYPFRLTDWLKQRQNDGRIIKTEVFKSGVIVQTRIN
jgi:4-amino-4-deoxy-L-arabinose transferase-like glycosyltransferase